MRKVREMQILQAVKYPITTSFPRERLVYVRMAMGSHLAAWYNSKHLSSEGAETNSGSQ